METLAHKQTTTHPSSHGEDEACVGGWDGYPSDHQTTLEKLHVGLSDNRDQAEEMLESETSGPVSGRTRNKKKKRSDASRFYNRNGDDQHGSSGDDDATLLLIFLVLCFPFYMLPLTLKFLLIDLSSFPSVLFISHSVRFFLFCRFSYLLIFISVSCNGIKWHFVCQFLSTC